MDIGFADSMPNPDVKVNDTHACFAKLVVHVYILKRLWSPFAQGELMKNSVFAHCILNLLIAPAPEYL